MKYKSKLSIYKVKKIIKFFCTDIDATKTAILLELNRNTINRWYNIFRQEIYDYQVNQKRLLYGEIELDENYFGGIHKGKRGRGAGGKTAVFGLLKRNGKVYTVVVKDTKQTTLMPIITSKIKPDSIVYTDSYRSYNALDVSDFKHFRINHSKEFADKSNKLNHINGIENFWNQAKRILRRYNGIKKENFHLFIKDEKHCFARFRFNYGTPSNQLKILRKWCEI